MHLILFTGVPGSGKSTFYQQHFFHSHLRVSLDLLRTRNREAQLLEFCFRTQMRLVVDNTNVRADDRLSYLQMARHHRYRITGYFFEATLEECLHRNAGRTGKSRIDDRGVIAKFRQLQPPSLAEGFDELFRVALRDGQFAVGAWGSRGEMGDGIREERRPEELNRIEDRGKKGEGT